MQKRSEASIVRAANLSDIRFIDTAKDVGGGLLGPKTTVNYVLAFIIGLLIPLVVVFLLFFINLFFMALLFLAFFVYSFINIH